MKIGIDLGGSHIAIGIIDDKNKILKKFEKNFTEDEKEKIVSSIENHVEKVLKDIKNEYEIEMIGIAVPGVSKDGIILKTVNLRIENYDIASLIKNIVDVPVIVRNDAKCATIAEYVNLHAQKEISKKQNMLLLTIGTGIGGGIIYNGRLLQGNRFEGFEMGHMVIKENGLPCKCGKNGCFEKYGSIVEHKKNLEHRLNLEGSISGDELRKVMEVRHDEIKDIEEEYLSNLALGISNLINIFEPDIVILGGGFTHYSHLYLNRLKNLLINSNLLFNKRDDIDLRIAKLGNDAGMIGATIQL